MKKNIAFLSLAAVVLVTILFVVFYNETSVDNNYKCLSDQQKQGIMLLRIAQESCLSGESVGAGLSLDISTNLIDELKAGAGIEKDSAMGAVNYLDEEIREIADEKIRNCLQKYMPRIEACIMGDCNMADQPKNIEFQFTYKCTEENINIEKDHVAFNLENRSNPRVLASQPGGYYEDTIALMDKGKERNAAIYNVVRESYAVLGDKKTSFCLKRATETPSSMSYHTKFDCEQGGGCLHDGISPKWFVPCEALGGLTDFIFSSVKSALAEQVYNIWMVPSIEKLQERKRGQDLIGIGYTHFILETLSPIDINADAYYYDISVNGRQVHVNGLPGNFNARPHDFKQQLRIEFGMQNLDFSGVTNGCDSLSLTLHFIKNEEETGEPVTLERSYVALRDARVKEFLRNDVRYRWSGKYQRAPKEFDTEVFVSSILVSMNLDFQKNQQGINEAKLMISMMKEEFDRLGLVFEGRPLVAVIRPPLTKISYGLAVGMVEETQQIRFTYQNGTARRLKKFLLEQRSRGDNYKKVIKEDTFLYSIRGEESYMASPPVCWDDKL